MDPFEILGVTRDSNKQQIRAAYIKLTLKYHPDRPHGDREKYYKISEAYEKLCNRASYEKLDIEGFEKIYRNSAEEKEEIKNLYIKFRGNICKIIDNMIIGRNEDECRIREYVADLLVKKEVEDYPLFKKKVKDNKKRLIKLEREAVLAEKMKGELLNKISATKGWNEMIDEIVDNYTAITEKKKTKKKKIEK